MHAKMSAVVLALVLFAVPAGAQTYVLDKAIKAAAGGYHVVQLKADGTVDAWMAKSMPEYPADYGQTMVPAGLRGVIDVAAGCYFSAALKSDGTVTAWGAFSYSVDPPGDAEFSDAVAISAGCEHLLVLKSDGTVETWPRYAAGDPMAVPADLGGHVVAVAAGGSYNLALRDDGSIRTWGSFDKAPDGKFIGISADPTTWSDTPMALRANGTVVTWGANGIPTEVALPRPAIAIEYPLAILDDGTVVKMAGASATAVPGKAGIVGIATGGSDYDISVFIQGVPTVPAAWGTALVGAPTDSPSFKALAAGDGHVVALRPDGTVAAWGDNGQNQTAVPAGLAGVKAVAAGCAHSLALKSDGTVVAWGSTTDGGSTVPDWLAGFPVRAIAAGCFYSLALGEDGHVYGWGRNTDGQVPTPTTEVVAAIAAGGNASLGLRANGTLAAWGKYETIPSATHVKAVSHKAALTSDGSVHEWDVSVSVPDGLTGVRAISAYPGSIAALMDDGAVRSRDGQDEVAPPAGMAAASSVAAGASTFAALTRPGIVRVEVGAQYVGLEFAVDGQTYRELQEFSWAAGTTHTVSTPLSQNEIGGAHFSFSRWSDDGAATHTITPAADATYTALFEPDQPVASVMLDIMPAALTVLLDGVPITGFRSYHFYEGSSHTLVAPSPQGAYVFDHWTDYGLESSTITAPLYTFTASTHGAVDAYFTRDETPRTVTVTTDPPGLTFYVNDVPYTSGQSFTRTAGDTLKLGTTSDQTLGDTRYLFTAWSDGGSLQHAITVPPGDAAYTAVFNKRTVAVNILTSPVDIPVLIDGVRYPGPLQISWVDGSAHTLATESPAIGADGLRYVFTGWSAQGTTPPSGATIPVTASSAVFSYTANFEREMSTVTLQTDPAGLQLAIEHDKAYQAPASLEWYVNGAKTVIATSPQLAGTAGTRYLFRSWSDGKPQTHQILWPSGGMTLTATYDTYHLLSIAVSPTGAGTVTPSPTSADGYYPHGANVTLVATPGPGYAFSGWSLDATGTNPTTAVAMGVPRRVVANFTAIVTTSTVVDAAAGQYGDSLTLRAVVSPATCDGSVRFSIDGQPPSAFTSYTGGIATNAGQVTPGAGSYEVKAVYTPKAGSSCLASEGTNTLTVTAENVTVTPDVSNPITVPVTSAGGASGPLAFGFTISDGDGSGGDLTKAVATVQLLPASGSAITCQVTAVTNAAGHFAATCASVPVNVYDVRAQVSGGYYTGLSESVLAVSDPSLGGVAGAGVVNTGDTLTQFAVSVRYLKSGQPQGSVLVMQPGKTSRMFKATSISSSSIVGNGAIILGKGTLDGVGNHVFKLTALGGDKAGATPQLGLEVKAPSGQPVAGLFFAPLPLQRGSIQVTKQK